MTLGEFFDAVSNNPVIILFYFIAIPLTAVLAGLLGKGEGHLSPWKYLYSTLVYLVSIPGIFAITLNIYLFLFEKRSIMDANIYTQILPVLVMILTLWIIRRNLSFDEIPGFDKLSGLMTVIVAILTLMWILEKTHIIAFTFMPFHYVLIMLAVLFVLVRIGVKRMMA
jgi:hypothetical protein